MVLQKFSENMRTGIHILSGDGRAFSIHILTLVARSLGASMRFPRMDNFISPVINNDRRAVVALVLTCRSE